MKWLPMAKEPLMKFIVAILIERGENMKKILATCIKQIIQFDSEAEFEAFLKKLIGTYHIVSENVSRDGTVIVEINRNYNNNKLIEN